MNFLSGSGLRAICQITTVDMVWASWWNVPAGLLIGLVLFHWD